MRVVTLIENEKNIQELISETGLSLYIEYMNKRILFDTGKSGKFIINAKKLGIDIKKIDMVIISHGHYDHIGGLKKFLLENDTAKIYMNSEVKKEFFFKFLFIKKNIGNATELLNEYSDRINFIEDNIEIEKNIYLIMKFPQKKKLLTNRFFFFKKNGILQKDNFEHELVMVIKESLRLNIFIGCGHNGVVNIINEVNRIFPDWWIYRVIGGFHLIEFPKIDFGKVDYEEIKLLLEIIEKKNIKKIYTCHCTGKRAYKYMKLRIPNKMYNISTGMEINS